ncbi:beta-ketoacyl-[acyl-carrier-protein] synthase family protein [Sulfurovum sp. bin170]|uniref:beta-ketoacyl-[acyl-carrier-protein] synthase family protein n=1 Tax=Sulfurovum sp. bin170 TaxID=2695268 RepID=UPI0013E05233|nr:beta-ketoacyl-[acyl-carrier-protein] synthase family protein [Sulfurovum sp. bin170]NEW60923.1 beta-ketoacyl-[acyl-carrier-protein] synthase family protein [Sulfurovum sp. bin170]
MLKSKEIYIQAMSASCCAGVSKEEIYESLLLSKSGIKKHKDFLIDGSLSAIGKIDSPHSFENIMLEQVEDVLKSSELESFHNTFLLVGSSVGGMAWSEEQFIGSGGSCIDIDLNRQSIYSISHTLNKKYGFKDSITFSTACTSSSNAIVFAKELLESGACEEVLVVGADSISLTTVNGFNALGVLSDECATPFDRDRTGMNVAEGVGVILLGSMPSDIKLVGVGCSSDAHNITHPHPEGNGAKSAMQNALDNANLDASSIDYINAHGTGTTANDRAEGRAIISLFPNRPLVGSTKSITGHTLGACGTIELIISAMVLKNQTVPQNFNLKNQELEELNLPIENISIEIKFALSNAFAFGGNNVSIIIQKVSDES